MTLREIVARLEAIEALWFSDSSSPRLLAVERLRLDLERAPLLNAERQRTQAPAS